MTGEEIRDLASYSPFTPGVRRAAVASQTAVYGALRMFSILREVRGSDDVGVFKSFAEAMEWLGLKAE